MANIGIRNVYTSPAKMYLATIDATDGIAIGSTETVIKLPKGAVVTGGVIRNLANDLAGTNATLNVTVGSTAVGTAVAIANAKGKVSYIDGSVAVQADDTPVKLTIAAAALTAGTIEVGVIYVA